MAGKTQSTTPTKLKGIQVQSSLYGAAIPLGYGTHRVSANLLWYGNFQSQSHTQSAGGKGGSANITDYTYTADVIMAVEQGTIANIRTIYRDKSVFVDGGTTALSQAGLSMATGALGQTPWTYLTTNFPSQAIGYSGIAYVYANNYALNSSGALENHSFEVQTSFRVTGLDDANPKDILSDFLPRIPFWPAGLIDATTLATCGTYWLATGLLLSPVLDTARQASEFVNEILKAGNATCVWSEGVLKFIPYGDTQVTGNGTTYTPNLTPQYDLDETMMIRQGDEDPVQVSIKRQADSWNYIQVEYLSRANNYSVQVVPGVDQASIDQYGRRANTSPESLHCICADAVANQVAQLLVQRSSQVRKTFTWRMGEEFGLLDPGDLVTLTSAELSKVLVRITEADEQVMSDGSTEILLQAEEMLVGSAHVASFSRQAPAGYVNQYNAAPGSVTDFALINANRNLTGGDYELWIGASGDNANWGGCHVWASLGGGEYLQIGTITSKARLGTTTTALADSVDPDNLNTVRVDVSTTEAQLLTGVQADQDNATTLCIIDNELIAYRDATLVSTGVYTLAHLRRGLYGSTHTSHLSGATFARLDDAFLRWTYAAQQVGATVTLKFQSFNLFGLSTEDLSTVSTHTVVLSPGAAPAVDLSGNVTRSQTAPSSPHTGDIWIQLDSNNRATGVAFYNGTTWAVAATSNNITSSTTAPTTPTVGDVWVVIDVNGRVTGIQTWTGSAWVSSATRNIITSSATAPATPTVGDVWIQLDSNGRQTGVATWSGSAWVTAATSNKITTSATAPTTPTVGDVWVVLDANGRVTGIQTWSGSAWVSASTRNTITSSATAPSTPVVGDVWVQLDANSRQTGVATWSGSAWITAATSNNITSSATAPSTPTVGDVWVALDANGRVTGISTWSGSAWVTASTKNVITTSATAPSTPTVGDIWVQLDSNGRITGSATWSGSAWVTSATRNTITSSIGAPSTPVVGDIWVQLDSNSRVTGVATWNGSSWVQSSTNNNIFQSASAPSTPTVGDIWIQLSGTTPIAMYVWSGSAWVQASTQPNQNLLPNPTGQLNDLTSWTNDATSHFTPAFDSQKGWGFVWNFGAAATYTGMHFFSDPVGSAIGSGVTFTIQAICDFVARTSGTIDLTLACYNSSDTFLGNATGSIGMSGGYVSGQFTTITNTDHVRVFFTMDNLVISSSAGQAFLYKVMLEKGSQASPWNDAATNVAARVDPRIPARFRPAGSVPPTVPGQSFTYSATTSSVTISWVTMTIYRPDQSTVTVSSGSLTISSLSAGTSYKVYPYATDDGSTGPLTMGWATGGTAVGSPADAYSSAGDAAGAAQMYQLGRIPLNGFTVATPSSGTSSGGGGGLGCLHPAQLVGNRRADELAVGDHLKSPEGSTAIRYLTRRSCSLWWAVCVDGEADPSAVVSEDHRFVTATGGEVRARDLRLGQLLATSGDHAEVTELRLVRDVADLVCVELDAPHLYYVGGRELLCHNPKP